MTSVCLLHAPADRAFSRELATFLETGCPVACYVDEGEHLVNQAELLGLSGDVLIAVLSAASCRAGWPDRARWEEVFVHQARETGVDVVFLEKEPCSFPSVWKRQFPFFPSRRVLKRWLWQRELGSGEMPRTALSPDLEDLYQAVGDRPGIWKGAGDAARRFSEEAAQDFAAVLWVPCFNRSEAQIVGSMGAQLRMSLPGTVGENRERILSLLAERRCLVVLDGIEEAKVNHLAAMGRTSTLVTTEPVTILETHDSYAAARELVRNDRLAEAYEMLERLAHDPELNVKCRREMSWILGSWGMAEDANRIQPGGQLFAEQLPLFG